MPKTYNSKPISLYSFHIPILLAAAIVVSASLASASITANNRNSDVLSKTSQKTVKTEKVKAVSKENKPDTAVQKNSVDPIVLEEDTSLRLKAPKSAKETHKVVSSNLSEVSEQEEEVGNDEVSSELEEIAAEVEAEDGEELEETIEEIESQPTWKILLVGADYKNLGQLRSAIVRNRNTIRKLTNTAEKATSEDSAVLIQDQIRLLEDEQLRLTSVVRENESQFSLFGWISKLLTGYQDIDVEDETDESTETPESTETTDTTDSTDTTDDTGTDNTETDTGTDTGTETDDTLAE